MQWLLLAAAIGFEIAGTTSLKYSHGFQRWPFAILMLVCYVISFSLLSLALKTLQVGIAYAIWSGAGTAIVATIGILVFDEPLTALKGIGILLIIAGVATLNLAASH